MNDSKETALASTALMNAGLVLGLALTHQKVIEELLKKLSPYSEEITREITGFG